MSNAISTSRNSKWIAAGLTLQPGGVANACRLYTTSWPAAATYVSGTQTWTADANGAMGTIDSVAPAVGDRVIYAAGGSSDGVFTVTSLGGASSKFTLIRSSDFQQTTDYLNANASTIGVYAGSTNGGKVFMLTVASNFVLDTGTPTFTASSSAVSSSTVLAALAQAAAPVDVNDQSIIDIGALTGTKETGLALTIAASTTGATAGGALSIAAGAGNGAAGGALSLDAGNGNTEGAITIGGTRAASVTLGKSGVLTAVAGPLGAGTPQALSGAGAANLTVLATNLTSGGAGEVVTLADATVAGHLKVFACISGQGAGNTTVVTPTTTAGAWTTLTFDTVGEGAILMWTGAGGWAIVGNNGGVMA